MRQMLTGRATEAQSGAFLASLTLEKCNADIIASLAEVHTFFYKKTFFLLKYRMGGTFVSVASP